MHTVHTCSPLIRVFEGEGQAIIYCSNLDRASLIGGSDQAVPLFILETNNIYVY